MIMREEKLVIEGGLLWRRAACRFECRINELLAQGFLVDHSSTCVGFNHGILRPQFIALLYRNREEKQ